MNRLPFPEATREEARQGGFKLAEEYRAWCERVFVLPHPEKMDDIYTR